jgi:molybdopterin-synthase adenylyltransferase
MSTFPFRKPLLPSHYRVLREPPDDKGDEVLQFVSESRRIKLKGHSFREFRQEVLPLLNGRHTVAEIADAVAEVFAPADLGDALSLLAEHGLLREGDAPGDLSADPAARLTPQLNLFHDLGATPAAVQERLAQSTVSIVGLGGAGAAAAVALAAAQVGTLRLVDGDSVGRSDPYLAPAYRLVDVGRPRAEVLRDLITTIAPEVKCDARAGEIASDEALREAIDGSHFVVCCLDAGRSSTAYKLNRVCLELRLNWLPAATAATEVIVGPAIKPHESACYLCYKMRIVACAQNPEDEYGLQSFLDRRKRDDSADHESLVFAETLAGNLAALETMKALCDMPTAATFGHVVVFDLLSLSSTRHRVLRKPWCPACQGQATRPARAEH